MDKDTYLEYVKSNKYTLIMFEYFKENGGNGDFSQFSACINDCILQLGVFYHIDPNAGRANIINNLIRYYNSKFNITSVIDEKTKRIIKMY